MIGSKLGSREWCVGNFKRQCGLWYVGVEGYGVYLRCSQFFQTPEAVRCAWPGGGRCPSRGRWASGAQGHNVQWQLKTSLRRIIWVNYTLRLFKLLGK